MCIGGNTDIWVWGKSLFYSIFWNIFPLWFIHPRCAYTSVLLSCLNVILCPPDLILFSFPVIIFLLPTALHSPNRSNASYLLGWILNYQLQTVFVTLFSVFFVTKTFVVNLFLHISWITPALHGTFLPAVQMVLNISTK